MTVTKPPATSHQSPATGAKHALKGSARTTQVATNSFVQFRGIPHDPARDGGVVHAESALRRQLLYIAVAQGVAQIPTDTQENDLISKMAPTEDLRPVVAHQASTLADSPGTVCDRATQSVFHQDPRYFYKG